MKGNIIHAHPEHDDAIRAVKLIVSKMADAVIEAKQGEAVYSDADVATEAEDIEEVAADNCLKRDVKWSAAQGTVWLIFTWKTSWLCGSPEFPMLSLL